MRPFKEHKAMYENKLPPLTAYTVINYPTQLVTIQIEARRARLRDGVAPAANNAWCYVRTQKPQAPGSLVRATWLGPIVNVHRGVPCRIRWINTLPGMMPMPGMPDMQDMQDNPPIHPKPMDPGMRPSIGVVTHLHGGKVHAGDALHNNDGWPLFPVGYVGNPYGLDTAQTYVYPNDQRAAMLWFHDHAMDNTATQVHAGLAGLYFIRDDSDDKILGAIGGAGQELPVVIQDRIVACGNDGVDYWAGIPTPNVAADYLRPEFLGDTVFVNGRAAPFFDADRTVYRLRILNGSNGRTYALALMDAACWTRSASASPVWYSDCMRVIGNEAGLLNQSQALSPTDYLLIAPGERLDVLLDLTGVADDVDCLRLVNLAVASARNDTGPEGIFQADGPSVQADKSSVLAPAANGVNDLDWASILQLGQANIMQLCLTAKPAAAALDVQAIDGFLLEKTDDEGFVLGPGGDGQLVANPANALGTTVARNRLVLLMNNNGKLQSGYPVPGGAWQDTQIWELGPDDGSVPSWPLPFDVDTATANPAAWAPPDPTAPAAPPTSYGIYRTTFFDDASAPNPYYKDVHPPTFRPANGTYERWYVVNVGNDLTTDVDMHPFHMHLVNFVTRRRWKLDAGVFNESTGGRRLDFDGSARHDTVRVQSNEIVELLVYFPPGYTGDYVYHCHLVEHEDMGMMLHFTVD
jgi:FtsP/CotA-like multicopper oxidase with cupredoxin domain